MSGVPVPRSGRSVWISWRMMNLRQPRFSASPCGRGEVFVVEDLSPARGAGEGPVAWMWLSTADGDLLLEQVSVDPAYRGKRIGSALIEGAVDHGRAEGFAGVVLTTFRDIPWNGPLYRRLGFRTMQDAEIGPELRAIRRSETEAGLDVLQRECLRKRITR